MAKKVLLIEDSKEIYQLVNFALSAPDIELHWAKFLQDSRNLLKEQTYDLILLDVELPDGNGFDLCREIHISNPEIPIFFLTSHTQTSHKVLGFSLGGEDYISKPFEPIELKARVEAKLKKIDSLKESSNLMRWKELTIDKSRQEVKIHHDANTEGEKISLTALEFKLLTYFATKVDMVISRDTILNDIWGQNIHVYGRSVDTHVSKLRKKLGPVSHIISSVHGSGYKFSPSS